MLYLLLTPTPHIPASYHIQRAASTGHSTATRARDESRSRDLPGSWSTRRGSCSQSSDFLNWSAWSN